MQHGFNYDYIMSCQVPINTLLKAPINHLEAVKCKFKTYHLEMFVERYPYNILWLHHSLDKWHVCYKKMKGFVLKRSDKLQYFLFEG